MTQERTALVGGTEEGVGAAPRRSTWSRGLTVASALVLAACLGLFAWLQLTVPPLARVPSPERALALTVGHTLDLEEALARAPVLERAFYRVLLGAGTGDLEPAIGWYEELAGSVEEPSVHLRLAILDGEAGRTEAIRRKAEDWAQREEPWPSLAGLVRAAYLSAPLPSAVEQGLQAELAELLPSDWFYDRLALRLAQRAGDRILEQATQEAWEARTAPLVWRLRLLALVQGLLAVLGGLVLLGIVFDSGRRRLLPIGTAPVPPLWRGREGVVVLIRGGALSAVLTLLFLFADGDNLVLRLLGPIAASLPLLVLADRHLLRPVGLGFWEGLGLQPIPGALGRLGLATLAVAALDFLGEAVLGLVADGLALTSHWTEWFDADLVWEPLPVVATTLVDYVVLAPVFEELVFRGLLFGTLRRRFGLGTSALLSAGLFALAHGYGWVGFASVLWSGVVWALAYEKTGSLLPGMAAHAINNLFVCLSVIGMLRL